MLNLTHIISSVWNSTWDKNRNGLDIVFAWRCPRSTFFPSHRLTFGVERSVIFSTTTTMQNRTQVFTFSSVSQLLKNIFSYLPSASKDTRGTLYPGVIELMSPLRHWCLTRIWSGMGVWMQGVSCSTLAVTSFRLHQLHPKNLSFFWSSWDRRCTVCQLGSDPADINLLPAAVKWDNCTVYKTHLSSNYLVFYFATGTYSIVREEAVHLFYFIVKVTQGRTFFYVSL